MQKNVSTILCVNGLVAETQPCKIQETGK